MRISAKEYLLMITIQKYVRAQSLEEAWQLNQNRRNRILGGMLWLRLGKGTVNTAILNFAPQAVKLIFGGSGIVPAAMVAILLNILLPKDKAE